MPSAEVKKSVAPARVCTPSRNPAQETQPIIGTFSRELRSAEHTRGNQPRALSEPPSSSSSPDVHAPGQDVPNLSSSRPKLPTPHELKKYSFGVEAQTIPLDAIGKDGKTTPQRFMGIQKDTLQGTIYYLSPADYHKVHGAYHSNSKASLTGSEVDNDSFFIKGRQITVVRLPDRGLGAPAIQKDGTLLLSPDEKRYLDALSLREHQHALGHGEYKALHEFYRRNDPNKKRSGDVNQPPALTDQEIQDLVTKHVLELHQRGLSEDNVVQIFEDMRAATGEHTLLASFLNADPAGQNSKAIESILTRMEVTPLNTKSLVMPPGEKELYKVELRQRKALTEDRVTLAQTLNFHNDSIETQRARLAPLLKRDSVLQELVTNSPIDLNPSTNFVLDTNQRSYAQVAARETNRQFTLTDGTTITADLMVRYHSRTQVHQPELPSYRTTLIHRNAQYELTQIPVIKAGTAHPTHTDAYVVVTNGPPRMYYKGQQLRATNAPDMLVTEQGHVFTRQGIAQTFEGKDIQVVTNAYGVPIKPNASLFLKGAWHIPHIPTAMDVVGR